MTRFFLWGKGPASYISIRELSVECPEAWEVAVSHGFESPGWGGDEWAAEIEVADEQVADMRLAFTRDNAVVGYVKAV